MKKIANANPKLSSLNLYGCSSFSSFTVLDRVRTSLKHLNVAATNADPKDMPMMPALQARAKVLSGD